MAGYCGLSKSNGAIDAEDRGLLKAGQLAERLEVSVAAVKATVTPREWHHVGGGFAKVDYYSSEVPDSQIKRAHEYDAKMRPCSWPSATASWLAWPSFKVGRFAKNTKNKPTVIAHEGCRITRLTPNTYLIVTVEGRENTKRATTKGLVIEVGGEKIVDNSKDHEN